MRRSSAVVGLVFSLATVAKAEAGSALPFELAWEAPASCPDASFVRHRIEQIVRAPPLAHTVVVGQAKVEAVAGGRFRLVLTLRTGDVEETKTITSGSCSSLAQATATIIALAIESPSQDADVGAPPPPSDSEPKREAPAAISPAPPSAPRPTPSTPTPAEAVTPAPDVSDHRFSFAPGAFVSLTTATLPDVAAGFGVSSALRLHGFRVGLLGTISLPQSASFSRTAGVSFDMLGGGAWGAYVVPLGRSIAVGPSADLEATFVRVRGFGVRVPMASSTVWPTLAAGGRLEAEIAAWLSLVARGELLFHVDPPRFSLATLEEPLRLHQPSVPAARMSLGAEIVLR